MGRNKIRWGVEIGIVLNQKPEKRRSERQGLTFTNQYSVPKKRKEKWGVKNENNNEGRRDGRLNTQRGGGGTRMGRCACGRKQGRNKFGSIRGVVRLHAT